MYNYISILLKDRLLERDGQRRFSSCGTEVLTRRTTTFLHGILSPTSKCVLKRKNDHPKLTHRYPMCTQASENSDHPVIHGVTNWLVAVSWRLLNVLSVEIYPRYIRNIHHCNKRREICTASTTDLAQFPIGGFWSVTDDLSDESIVPAAVKEKSHILTRIIISSYMVLSVDSNPKVALCLALSIC